MMLWMRLQRSALAPKATGPLTCRVVLIVASIGSSLGFDAIMSRAESEDRYISADKWQRCCKECDIGKAQAHADRCCELQMSDRYLTISMITLSSSPKPSMLHRWRTCAQYIAIQDSTGRQLKNTQDSRASAFTITIS